MYRHISRHTHLHCLLPALISTALLAFGISAPINARAQIVLPGWDLLETVAADTSFGGVSFKGVPLEPYDFGGGPKAVGNTDTIVQRLDTANAPTDVIPIELVALHLQSVNPVDFGLGIDFYFITLQSERGGPVSTGQALIDFQNGQNGGTFSSFFDVFFDVRKGDLNGPIAFSQNLRLSQQGNPWSRVPPPGAVKIPGVNTNLNGQNHDADFWPIGVIKEGHPSGATHGAKTATPEPGSLAFLGGFLISGAAFAMRRRKASR